MAVGAQDCRAAIVASNNVGRTGEGGRQMLRWTPVEAHAASLDKKELGPCQPLQKICCPLYHCRRPYRPRHSCCMCPPTNTIAWSGDGAIFAWYAAAAGRMASQWVVQLGGGRSTTGQPQTRCQGRLRRQPAMRQPAQRNEVVSAPLSPAMPWWRGRMQR